MCDRENVVHLKIAVIIGFVVNRTGNIVFEFTVLRKKEVIFAGNYGNSEVTVLFCNKVKVVCIVREALMIIF